MVILLEKVFLMLRVLYDSQLMEFSNAFHECRLFPILMLLAKHALNVRVMHINILLHV